MDLYLLEDMILILLQVVLNSLNNKTNIVIILIIIITKIIGSDINDRLAELQEDEDIQLVLYGDRIFLFESHTIRAHMGHEDFLTDLELLENKIFAKVRIAVEWAFGHTSMLFKFTQTCQTKKTSQSPRLLLHFNTSTKFTCLLLWKHNIKIL